VLCRRLFGDQGTIVFGWVFASHQFGAAAAALTAGIIRDTFGSYTYAWFGGAALCLIAAVLSSALRKQPDLRQTSAAANDRRETEIEAETASDLTP
jgi:predicted MFS family arabinose efflux permease